MKVLIADDSSLVRKNVRRLLSTIASVSALCESDSVASTIRSIDREHPDALILDLHLPDGTGYEVLMHLERYRERPKVIVLTTFAGEIERERAFALGADYFLDKSTEYEQLFDLL